MSAPQRVLAQAGYPAIVDNIISLLPHDAVHSLRLVCSYLLYHIDHFYPRHASFTTTSIPDQLGQVIVPGVDVNQWDIPSKFINLLILDVIGLDQGQSKALLSIVAKMPFTYLRVIGTPDLLSSVTPTAATHLVLCPLEKAESFTTFTDTGMARRMFPDLKHFVLRLEHHPSISPEALAHPLWPRGLADIIIHVILGKRPPDEDKKIAVDQLYSLLFALGSVPNEGWRVKIVNANEWPVEPEDIEELLTAITFGHNFVEQDIAVMDLEGYRTVMGSWVSDINIVFQ